MQIFEQDLNNYYGIQNQVLDLNNKEHVQYLLEILQNRAVSLESDKFNIICNSNQVDMLSFGKNKDLIIYQSAEKDENVIYSNEFNPVVKIGVKQIEFDDEYDDMNYVFIQEKALVQGVMLDEDGKPCDHADLVGIEVLFLTHWGHIGYNGVTGEMEHEDFTFNYDEWLDEDEDTIRSNFELSKNVVNKSVEGEESIKLNFNNLFEK